MNAELLEGSCCVQTCSNVLWKLAAVLIDILWQATLPLCWYKSSADSAVSGPLLYWLSHWSSLWSTKGMKKRKETSLASQRMHVCSLSISLLSHRLSSISPQTLTKYTNMLQQGLTVVSGDTHSLKLQHKALQCCSSVLYRQLYQGHWYHVGIGLDFLQAFRAHTCMWHVSYFNVCLGIHMDKMESTYGCWDVRPYYLSLLVWNKQNNKVWWSVFSHSECTHLYLAGKS